MRDTRIRPDRGPKFKSAARLAAEAAFRGPDDPPDGPGADHPLEDRAGAVDAYEVFDAQRPLAPLQQSLADGWRPAHTAAPGVVKPVPLRGPGGTSAARTPAVHVVRRRLPVRDDFIDQEQDLPQQELEAGNDRQPRVHVLPAQAPLAQAQDAGVDGEAAVEAPQADVERGSAVAGSAFVPRRRRRRREAAAPVTVIYRAEPKPQPLIPLDLRTDAPPPPGSPRHLAQMQAAIDTALERARLASEFELGEFGLPSEWSRIERELDSLTKELKALERQPALTFL